MGSRAAECNSAARLDGVENEPEHIPLIVRVKQLLAVVTYQWITGFFCNRTLIAVTIVGAHTTK